MRSTFQDVRYASRQAARQPGLAVIIVLTVALGVGSATAAFSILDTMVWRSPPYPAIERLAVLFASAPSEGQERHPLAASTIAHVRESGQFEAMVAYATQEVNAVGSASAERVSGAAVSGDLFGLLGARLVRGRGFTHSDYAGGVPVAVISESLGARLVAGRDDALHSTISLDGRPHTVIGVVADGFAFPGETLLWVPLAATTAATPPRHVWAIGRLPEHDTTGRASAALAGIGPATDWASGPERSIRVVPLRESLTSPKHQAAATVLLVTSGLVLLAACINLAGLVLANLTARRTEFALRAAIGAKRFRIVRLVVIEQLLLTIAGGLLGLGVAAVGVQAFVAALGSPTGASWLEFGLRAPAIGFALGVSLLTTLVVGVWPAIRVSRADLRSVLLEGAGQTSGGPGSRHRRLMAIVQVAVSLALVAAASSVVSSSIGLDRAPTGFDPHGLLRARVSLGGDTYEAAIERTAFIARARHLLERLPGVVGVTAASRVPVIDRRPGTARVTTDPSAPLDGQPMATVWYTAHDYPETMGISMVRGRAFSMGESQDPAARVALVNESMAQRYWADGNPIGHEIRMAGLDAAPVSVTVIGVVGDVAQRLALPEPADGAEPRRASENQVYLPVVHTRDVSFVVRTTSETAGLTPRLLDAVGAIDATVPVSVETMRAAYEWYVWDRRAQGLVLGVLGSVALAIAGLGILGIMSLMVANRRREIGLRLALGSTPSAIRRLVLRASLGLTAIGMLWGLLLGTAATIGLSAIFVGVKPFDVGVFAMACAVLTTVALVATWWPARRAMNVDPMTSLKADRA